MPGFARTTWLCFPVLSAPSQYRPEQLPLSMIIQHSTVPVPARLIRSPFTVVAKAMNKVVDCRHAVPHLLALRSRSSHKFRTEYALYVHDYKWLRFTWSKDTSRISGDWALIFFTEEYYIDQLYNPL